MTKPTIAEPRFSTLSIWRLYHLTAVKVQLRREGYSDIQAHLEGRTIAAALRSACAQAVAHKADNPSPETADVETKVELLGCA